MIDNYITTIILFIFGFGSGISVGIASGTSGSFLIPCLTIFIGHSIHRAIGTSLLVDCIIGGVAALIAGFGAIIGAISGSVVASKVDENKLGRLIGVIFIVLGIAIFLNMLL